MAVRQKNIGYNPLNHEEFTVKGKEKPHPQPLSTWKGEIINLRDGFKKTKLVLLTAAILIASAGIVHGQTRSNLEIFDKAISERIEEILYMPDLHRGNQFIFRIRSLRNNDDEVKFVTSVIKKTADKIKIRASFSKEMSSSDSIYNAVWIDISELGTKYPGFSSNKFLGEKFVKRNLFGSIRVEISAAPVSYNNRDSITINYADEINYMEIENIESVDYKFTHSKAPQVSTFEDLIFPAAIIAITALAAVLFFTIRSK